MKSPTPISTGELVARLVGVLFFLFLGVLSILWGLMDHGWVGASMAAIAFIAGGVLSYFGGYGLGQAARRWRGRRP